MKNDYPIARLCTVLAVSRSGFHAWAGGRRSVREQRDTTLRPKIRAAFAASRQTYGYPRLTVELREQRERVGKVRVARLMKEEGLCGRPLKRYRPQTTQSNHDGPIAPNRLAAIATITGCNQVWQTDITYLPTVAGWLYLAVVIDAYSKRVIGWGFSASLATDFVITALLMAVQRRGGQCSRGLLLHSDRGVQYASERFRAQLAAHGITASMSRRGNCYDNARPSPSSRPSKSSTEVTPALRTPTQLTPRRAQGCAIFALSRFVGHRDHRRIFMDIEAQIFI